MRRVSPLVRSAGDTDLNTAMTPMIDVVFLLLVFFVWTASFQVVEFLLPSDVSAQVGSDPVAADDPPPPDDFEDVVIQIRLTDDRPEWVINEQVIDRLQTVGQRLTAIAEIGTEDVTVILDPDPVVPLGSVISTFDTAKTAGFDKVSFAVDPSEI